jgi:outer membrane protein OmpA-like peptidoglycan-associated protein
MASHVKARCLAAATVLSAVVASAYGSPREGSFVIAQAPPQTDQDKQKKRPERPGQQAPQQPQGQPSATPQRQVQPPPERQIQPPPPQQRQMQPPPPQRREAQPPSPSAQPPITPQQRQVQPPSQQLQPPPGSTAQPPLSPQQRQVQPPSQQLQPPPGSTAQPPLSPQQRQVQPPSPQLQPPSSPSGQMQTPSTTGQPTGASQTPTTPQRFERAGPGAQPPPPLAPNQSLGSPAIAPSTLQAPPPPPGSPAAQNQRTFIPPPAQDSARRLEDLRGARREVRDGDRLLIEEPGRVIIQEGGQTIIRHNDADRFRWQAQNVRIDRRGSETATIFDRADGSRIYSVSDEDGRLLRRYRRLPDGREIIIIDNHYRGPPRPFGYFVELPPPVIRIPRERYIVDAQYARPDDLYYALWAGPVDYIDRPYTLDEIRYSVSLRERMPRVDLDTVTFDTGSWEVTPDQIDRLSIIADGMNRAIAANPSEVFLIEGHTDAVGSDIDNLSLSDRRAESVALVLSQQFGVAPENLTTQGYGAHYLKVPTPGPEPANRRVTVRRITPLLTGQSQPLPLAR